MAKNLRFLGQEFGGPVIFAGVKGGELRSLSEKDAELVLRLIRNK